MKPDTNNLTGLIDNIDKSFTFDNFQPEKGTLYFTGRDHLKYYNQMVKNTGTGAEDREQLALFYILASRKKFREAPGKFIYLNKIKPNPRAFKELLTPGEQALVQLAFYLFTERDIFKISFMDLFTNLDDEKALIAIDGFKLRFGLKIN
ncbi:MAG: DUF6075 family protein [Candidatus Woesearchaeota archaeon]